jgi:acylphosphatase
MKDIAKRIIFRGRVQGVGFRFTALNVANQYQLTGLVKNLPDGTVEMIAQGCSDDITDCVRDISESFGYNVKDTQVEDVPVDPRYRDFKITF